MSEDMNNAVLDEEEGIIELEDEDGNVVRFEFIDAVEHNGVTYYALVPESDEEDGADQFVVLKEQEIDGQSMLATIDSDEEYQEMGEIFLQRFAELAGYDEDEDEAEELQ
ncbi:MAG: DUF1292 domain-containing protein [Oscillospiraceae bacterium]|nr:DUF1292 domain-containing protein [Oscillospiraceae bacterium]